MASVQCTKPDEVTIQQEKAQSAGETHAHNQSGGPETEKGQSTGQSHSVQHVEHKASPGKTEKLSKAMKEKKCDDRKKDKKEKKSDEHKKDKKEKKSNEHKKEKKEKKCQDHKKEKSHDKKKWKDGKSSDSD